MQAELINNNWKNWNYSKSLRNYKYTSSYSNLKSTCYHIISWLNCNLLKLLVKAEKTYKHNYYFLIIDYNKIYAYIYIINVIKIILRLRFIIILIIKEMCV